MLSDQYQLGEIYWNPRVGYFAVSNNSDIPVHPNVKLNIFEVDSPELPPIGDETADAGLGSVAFEKPSSLVEWSDEAPAKVAVAALIDLDRHAAVAEIRERIESVLDLRWDRWWRVCRTHLMDQSFVRTRPNKSIRINSGNSPDDVMNIVSQDGDNQAKILSPTERREVATKIVKDPSISEKLPLSEFRRILRILDDRDALNSITSDLHIGSFNRDQLWILFETLKEPNLQRKLSIEALRRTLLKQSEPTFTNDERESYARLPGRRGVSFLENFLPGLTDVLLKTSKPDESTYISTVVGLILASLTTEDETVLHPKVHVLYQLLTVGIRLSPKAFVGQLAKLSESQIANAANNRVIQTIFSPSYISKEIAIGIWVSYVSDPNHDRELAASINRKAFGGETSSELANMISALQGTILGNSNIGASTGIQALEIAAISNSLPDDQIATLEQHLFRSAQSTLRSDSNPEDGSLDSILFRVISRISSAQRSTNRRVRSDLTNTKSDLEAATSKILDLKQRLAELSRGATISSDQRVEEAKQEVLTQLVTALQFTQAAMHRYSGSDQKIDFGRITSEIEQYLPIRTEGDFGVEVVYDPGIHDWKGHRTKKPDQGGHGVVIAQGWLLKAEMGSPHKVLTKIWVA